MSSKGKIHIKKVAKSLTERVVFVTGDVVGAGTEAFLKKTKVLYVTKLFDASHFKREIKRLLIR